MLHILGSWKNWTTTQWIFRNEIFAIFPWLLWRHPAKTAPKFSFFLETHGHVKLDQNLTWYNSKQVWFSWALPPRPPCKRYWRSNFVKGQKIGKGFVIVQYETSERRNSDKNNNKCVKTLLRLEESKEAFEIILYCWKCLNFSKWFSAISTKTCQYPW